MEDETKLKIYELIISRYKLMISEKEERNITELRQRCSPYNDFIREKAEKFRREMNLYSYGKHFLQATERATEYLRSIKSFDLGLTFWLSFNEMDSLKAASSFDKSLLLCALLRSLESENARVAVTKQKKNYVLFEFADEKYAINIETGSMLAGEDCEKLFQNDKMLYVFSDLTYDNYE